jgi:hypothetical protein
MRRALTLATLFALTLPAAAPAANGWWAFNRNTNLDSVLSWTWTYPPDTTRYSKSWRAGSGTTTNECEKGKGWLPAGWYALWGHWNGYPGSVVRGRVWWVQDKYCANGITLRTELFIHTEETAQRGQYCTSAYDDPFCWERAADYYSLGCIKVARPSPVASFPDDVGSAHSYYHSYGGSSAHGDLPNDANELYVFT